MEKAFSLVALSIGIIVVPTVVFALPTMWLWNWLMPELFGLSQIGFWQAVGINILSGLLFKSYTPSKS